MDWHDRLERTSHGSLSGMEFAEGERRMDANRFSALSRRMGAAPSRRAAIGILATGITGALLARQGTEEAEAGIPIVNCQIPGKRCKGKNKKGNQKCCSGRCRGGRCMCSRKGRACWSPLEGALCCSGRCQNGVCQ